MITSLNYENKRWDSKQWTIGETIDEDKLNNIDDGMQILATRLEQNTIVYVVSSNAAASDNIAAASIPLNNGLMFILIPHGTLGQSNLTITSNNVTYPIYIGNSGCTAALPQNYLLGLYRQNDIFRFFNAPLAL